MKKGEPLGIQDFRKIMESRVKPEDWKKEVNMLKKELDRLVFEFEHFNEIASQAGPARLNLEGWMRAGNKLHDLKDQLRVDKVDKMIARWENDVERIHSGESRVNKACVNLIEELKELVESRKEMHSKLRFLSESVQMKIESFDLCNRKFQLMSDNLKNKVEDVFGEHKVKLLQERVNALKVYWTSLHLIL